MWVRGSFYGSTTSLQRGQRVYPSDREEGTHTEYSSCILSYSTVALNNAIQSVLESEATMRSVQKMEKGKELISTTASDTSEHPCTSCLCMSHTYRPESDNSGRYMNSYLRTLYGWMEMHGVSSPWIGYWIAKWNTKCNICIYYLTQVICKRVVATACFDYCY